ncbi:hypothetical protein AAFF_G00205500 [Aldrovandia affinis]|uniref:Uncharacterized protein n=1 Tax=Aldrovandia affinis TaxID=143900 RepID=A0AAD7W5E7_9TELE|nr:hypothetical protein AAFF_G00205500 [Aldrovandia affinis]
MNQLPGIDMPENKGSDFCSPTSEVPFQPWQLLAARSVEKQDDIIKMGPRTQLAFATAASEQRRMHE